MSTNNEQSNCDVHLHAEIEALKQALVEKQNQLISMETACLRESDRQAELEDSIIAWQDKYDRLYESHKRVQKVNQNLEDKLLKLVDRNSGERAQLTSDVATLSVRLAQANYNIAKLQREIERYKTDINLAIQLLQCKPDSFVPQKVSSLPMDIQSKVSSYMRLETNSHSDSEGSTSGVGMATSNSYKVLPASDSPPPICPFPPTAMVYSMRGLDAQNPECNDSSEQMISPSVMAKFLEDELKASEVKHCDTCNCSNKDLTVLADEPKTYSIGIQTILHGDTNSSLCLRCNSNLNSPSRTNSPYIMKLVKSSDSVISETKSSVSDFNETDKLFTPAKKDDLMVNPILGHHRLCDRTINNNTNNNNNNTNHINNIGNSKQFQSTSSTILSGINNNSSINHQLNINDTAKYLMENQHNSIINIDGNINSNSIMSTSINRKKDDNDDHDLIDLNKFSNNTNLSSDSSGKSPKMAVKNDITCNINSTFSNRNNQQISDNNNKLNNNNNNNSSNNKNASRKSDSNNLLIDNTELKNNGIVQGNSNVKNGDNSMENNTDDKKLIENNENEIGNGNINGNSNSVNNNNNNNCSADGFVDRSNLQTSATGSTNSLWSKTSSNEGAKIFENFNRNLIKTIKAENPKYRGPRLCALRIQNGSNNILLDSIESEVTPILYTRRQRFLDEELDDNKDIITSKISAMSSNSSAIHSQNSTSNSIVGAGITSQIISDTITPLSPNKQINPNENRNIQNDKNSNSSQIRNNIENKSQQQNNINSMVMINNQSIINSDNTFNLVNERKTIINNSKSLLDQQKQHQKTTAAIIQNYDITLCDNSLNSSCKNTNSKSCTQSSSISSNSPDAAIDLQENVLLRRQQLTRVAEWVQNNSQMEQNLNSNSHNKIQINNANSNNNSNSNTICNFSNTNNTNNTSNSNNNNNNNSNYSNSICSNNSHYNIDNMKFPLPNINNNSKNKINSFGILSNNDFNYKFKKQQQLATNNVCNNNINSNTEQQIKQKLIKGQQIMNPLPASSTSSSLSNYNHISQKLISIENSNTKFINNYGNIYVNNNETNNDIAQNNQIIINHKYFGNEEDNRNFLKTQQQQQYQKSKQLNAGQDIQQNLQEQELKQYQECITGNDMNDKRNNNDNIGNGSIDQLNYLMERNQVDLAQMEYNVKQFLLKQNEWSIRNKSPSVMSPINNNNNTKISNPNNTIDTDINPIKMLIPNNYTTTNNTGNIITSNIDTNIDNRNNNNSNKNPTSDTMTIVKCHPHRTETNL